MIEDYEEKLNQCLIKQHFICPVCKGDLRCSNNSNCVYNLWELRIDLHHKLRNHKSNRKKFPLMIDSIENLEAVHHDCHIYRHGEAGKLSDIEAQEIENILREAERC